jgi:hypothetical protein
MADGRSEAKSQICTAAGCCSIAIFDLISLLFFYFSK